MLFLLKSRVFLHDNNNNISSNTALKFDAKDENKQDTSATGN